MKYGSNLNWTFGNRGNMARFSRLADYFRKIQAGSGLDSLSKREKWILAGGLIFVVCFLIMKLAVLPFIDSREQLKQALVRKKNELVEINRLQEEYKALQVQEGTIQAQIAGRDPQFSLFTFLDRQAAESGVKKQIQSMKPSVVEGEQNMDEALVDMKLQKISLKALVDFLLLVESEKFVVFIKRISIQENSAESGLLDVNLQLATFVAKGK